VNRIDGILTAEPVHPILGPMRRCRCGWWPDDPEFFYDAPSGSHPTRLCRACRAAAKTAQGRRNRSRRRYRARLRAQVAAVRAERARES
jgi:hypothetical protein